LRRLRPTGIIDKHMRVLSRGCLLVIPPTGLGLASFPVKLYRTDPN
jgi:hypothetical protein